jgi:hypothetical protein
MVTCIDEESETWNLIKQAEAGLVVSPENPSVLVEAILTLRNDWELCKRNERYGCTWAENYHSPKSCVRQIEKIVPYISSSKKYNQISSKKRLISLKRIDVNDVLRVKISDFNGASIFHFLLWINFWVNAKRAEPIFIQFSITRKRIYEPGEIAFYTPGNS